MIHPNGAKRRGFSLFGLLLVAFGALLLLTVTGVVGLGMWFELARYWPVLLVLIGIKMILARRAPLVGMAVVSITLVATIVAASVPLSVERRDEAPRIAYSTPLENTETLELGMGFISGRVTLRSDISDGRLFAVDFNGRSAEVIHDHIGRFSKIYLSTDGFSIDYSDDGGMNGYTLTGLADWEIMVSPDVALDLDIRGPEPRTWTLISRTWMCAEFSSERAPLRSGSGSQIQVGRTLRSRQEPRTSR